LKVSEGNSQVLVTTHSPVFASGQRFENVRMFRRGEGGDVVHSAASLASVAAEVARISGAALLKPEGVRAKIHQALLWSLSDMFFGSKVIFVEGAEDVAFLSYFLHASDRLDALRAKGVNIVACASKSGMIQAVAIAECLKIPFFLVWDSDGQEDNATRRLKHERDNLALLNVFPVNNPIAFPADDVFTNDYVCWSEEIASRVKRDLGGDWNEINNRACDACGHAPNLGKNSVYISELIVAVLEANKTLDGLERAVTVVNAFAGIE
jgi:hypothetical protein